MGPVGEAGPSDEKKARRREQVRRAQQRYRDAGKQRRCIERYQASEKGTANRKKLMHEYIESGTHREALTRARERNLVYKAELFAPSPGKRVHLGGISTVVVLSDLQMPFEDPHAVQEALNVLHRVSPDLVILNGDVVDCYAESVFLKDPEKAKDSTAEGHERARQLMKLLAHVKVKVWMGGNHEDRWRRVLWAQQERRGALDPVSLNLVAMLRSRGEALNLADPVDSFQRIFDMGASGFSYYPYSHRLYLAEDNLVVTHGKYVSKHSGYTAKRTYEWLGRSAIVGHTHRMGTYRITQDGREHGAWENGCLCVTEPEYDDAPNWQLGFSVVKINGPEFHVVQVPIIRQRGVARAIYGGLGSL